MKKTLVLILSLYILALIQTSFSIHFPISLNSWGDWSPNLILIIVVLINFLETPQKNLGIFAAATGGFFLDIFSENFIGFHILILLALSFLIKFILRKYVYLPIIKQI